jgi:nitrogen regulatory protein P-II 1
MKEVKAYITRHKLDAVTRALHKIEGLTGMSVSERHGHGIGWARAEVTEEFDYQRGVKLEIVCQDDLVEQVLVAIQKTAHTGLKGDGKIYVCTIDQAVRISTGERGEDAV